MASNLKTKLQINVSMKCYCSLEKETRLGKACCWVFASCWLVACLAYTPTLKMEELRSYEINVNLNRLYIASYSRIY
jgi:hypothetical protein